MIEADTGLYHQWDVILRAKETKVKRCAGGACISVLGQVFQKHPE
jgi:hypothetical protein